MTYSSLLEALGACFTESALGRLRVFMIRGPCTSSSDYWGNYLLSASDATRAFQRL